MLALRGSLLLLLIWGAYHLTAQSEALALGGNSRCKRRDFARHGLHHFFGRWQMAHTARRNHGAVRDRPAEVTGSYRRWKSDPLRDIGTEIAARVTCENGAVAHTSPIYFLANGQSFRDPEQLSAIAAKRLDFIETRMKTPGLAKEYSAEEEALRERIAEARVEYQKLSREDRK